MTLPERLPGDATPGSYRILHEPDLRDYLARLPKVADVLGGAPGDWSIGDCRSRMRRPGAKHRWNELCSPPPVG